MSGVPSLLLAAMLAGPGGCTIWARTLFVAPDGSDGTGTGERERPLRSLTAALEQAVSGDILEVRAGTYREPGEIRFRNPGVTLRAHAGERVILAAPLDAEESHSACVWIDPEAHHTTLSGLEITGGWYYGITLVDVCRQGVHAAIYFGLSYQDWEPGAGRPPSAQPVIRGNLVVQPSASTAPMLEIRHSDDLGGLSALTGWPDMEFNGYHVPGPGGAVFTDQRPGTGFERIDLARWRSASGADQHSLEGDPVLLAHLALGIPWQTSLPRARLIPDGNGRTLALTLFRDPELRGMTVEVLASEQPVGPWTPVAVSVDGQAYAGVAVRGETRLPNGRHTAEIQDAVRTDAVGSRFLQVRVRR